MRKFVNLIVVVVLSTAGARADGITIALDDPNQTGTTGEALNFTGTITNTDPDLSDQPIYLNSDSLNFNPGDATVTDNFFANVPVSLAPGTSSGDIDLFDIVLAAESDLYGTYTGIYGLLGGMDGGAQTAQDNLAQVNFSVDVVPEPATFALLGVGLALTSSLHRRAQRRNK